MGENFAFFRVFRGHHLLLPSAVKIKNAFRVLATNERRNVKKINAHASRIIVVNSQNGVHTEIKSGLNNTGLFERCANSALSFVPL